MKVQGRSLVHNFSKKNEFFLSNSRYKVVKTEVVLEDMGVRENGAKTHVT